MKMKTNWCIRISILNAGKFELLFENYFPTRQKMRESISYRSRNKTSGNYIKCEVFKVLISEEHETRVYLPR